MIIAWTSNDVFRVILIMSPTAHHATVLNTNPTLLISKLTCRTIRIENQQQGLKAYDWDFTNFHCDPINRTMLRTSVDYIICLATSINQRNSTTTIINNTGFHCASVLRLRSRCIYFFAEWEPSGERSECDVWSVSAERCGIGQSKHLLSELQSLKIYS